MGRRLAVLIAVVVGLVALGLVLYPSSVHAAPGNSDAATAILEGKVLSDRNLALNHWALSLDSFWSVDVPLNAIAVLLAGVRPSAGGNSTRLRTSAQAASEHAAGN